MPISTFETPSFGGYVTLFFFFLRAASYDHCFQVWIVVPIYLMLISISFVIIPLGSATTRMPVMYGYGFLILGSLFYGVQELVNYCVAKNSKTV